MTGDQFDQHIENCISRIQETLQIKGKEYARNGNRFHNFDRAADMTGETPQKGLAGMMLKHWISILDIIEDDEFSMDQVSEKISDAINYLILLEGLFLRDSMKDHLFVVDDVKDIRQVYLDVLFSRVNQREYDGDTITILIHNNEEYNKLANILSLLGYVWNSGLSYNERYFKDADCPFYLYVLDSKWEGSWDKDGEMVSNKYAVLRVSEVIIEAKKRGVI